MTVLAGVDFSTKAIHVAFVPLDPDVDVRPMLAVRELPKTRDPAERVRAARRTLRFLLRCVETMPWGLDVTSLWVEEPIGQYRNADRALLPLYGALLTCHTAATGITAQDWRHALGIAPRASKADLIAHAHRLAAGTLPAAIDDHCAESYLVAIAGRKLIWEHDSLSAIQTR